MPQVPDPPEGGGGPAVGSDYLPPPPGGGPPPALGGGGGDTPLATTAAQRYLPYYKRKQLVLEQSAAPPAALQMQGTPAAGGGTVAGAYNPYNPNPGNGAARGYGAAGSSDGGDYLRSQAAQVPAAPAPGYGDNPFLRPDGFNTQQGVQSILGGGAHAGAFNADGSGAALELLKHYLQLKGEGDVRQAQLGADLYSPNDPLMGQYARNNAELHARDNTTMGVAQAQAGFAQNNSDHLWALLQQYLQPSLRKDPKTDWAGDISSLIGTGIGALAGKK